MQRNKHKNGLNRSYYSPTTLSIYDPRPPPGREFAAREHANQLSKNEGTKQNKGINKSGENTLSARLPPWPLLDDRNGLRVVQIGGRGGIALERASRITVIVIMTTTTMKIATTMFSVGQVQSETGQ